MNRRGLVIVVTGTILFAAVVYYAADITIHRSGAVVSLFYDNETVLGALNQLAYAEVKPPLWLPLICGFIATMVIYAAFMRKKRNIATVIVKTAAVFGVLLITVSAYAGSVYFAEVNGVPVCSAGKIIVNIIEGGLLG